MAGSGAGCDNDAENLTPISTDIDPTSSVAEDSVDDLLRLAVIDGTL